MTFRTLHLLVSNPPEGPQTCGSADLESRGTAAPVDLHQVTVADALVQTGAGQTGVTLGQHRRVHITWVNEKSPMRQ